MPGALLKAVGECSPHLRTTFSKDCGRWVLCISTINKLFRGAYRFSCTGCRSWLTQAIEDGGQRKSRERTWPIYRLGVAGSTLNYRFLGHAVFGSTSPVPEYKQKQRVPEIRKLFVGLLSHYSTYPPTWFFCNSWLWGMEILWNDVHFQGWIIAPLRHYKDQRNDISTIIMLFAIWSIGH